MFKNRSEAGRRLALKLKQYKNSSAVVLALPRGGLPVAYEIARALKLSLDIFSVRKVGHPYNSEYAIGAVDNLGNQLCNEEEIKNIDPRWLKEEIEKQKQEAKRRAAIYRQGEQALEIKNKNVILVDDGAATGLTLRLAIQSLKKMETKEIIVAIPVTPKRVAIILREAADKLAALEIPEFFQGAVGAYYEDFGEVSNQEVISLLTESRTA